MFLKKQDETFAFLSRSSDQNSEPAEPKAERRIRQTVREVLHSRSESKDTPKEEKSRIRDTIKEKYHNVKDKVIHHKTTTKTNYPVQPQYPAINPNPHANYPAQPQYPAINPNQHANYPAQPQYPAINPNQHANYPALI